MNKIFVERKVTELEVDTVCEEDEEILRELSIRHDVSSISIARLRHILDSFESKGATNIIIGFNGDYQAYEFIGTSVKEV